MKLAKFLVLTLVPLLSVNAAFAEGESGDGNGHNGPTLSGESIPVGRDGSVRLSQVHAALDKCYVSTAVGSQSMWNGILSTYVPDRSRVSMSMEEVRFLNNIPGARDNFELAVGSLRTTVVIPSGYGTTLNLSFVQAIDRDGNFIDALRALLSIGQVSSDPIVFIISRINPPYFAWDSQVRIPTVNVPNEAALTGLRLVVPQRGVFYFEAGPNDRTNFSINTSAIADCLQAEVSRASN